MIIVYLRVILNNFVFILNNVFRFNLSRADFAEMAVEDMNDFPCSSFMFVTDF